MMGLPVGFTVRAAAVDDLEAVAAVFAADDIEDVGEVVLDADFIGSAWNRSGFDLATVLLDRIEGRAGQLLAGVPDAKFRQSVNAGDRAAAAMLQARGLRLVRHFWHMGIDLEGPVQAGRTPDGIQIAGVDPDQDLPAMRAVLIEAF